MAITDNSFTVDEFQAAIEANPALKDALGTSAYVTSLKDAHISQHVGEFAPMLEKDVFEISGAKKASDTEKYYDYNKRVLTENVTKRKELETELETLKKSSNITEAERTQLTTGQQKIKDLEKQLTELSEKHQKDLSVANNKNDVLSAVSQVQAKLIKDTKPGVAQAQKMVHEATVNEILSMSDRDSRGAIILLGADKKPLLNKDNSFVTPEQYYEQKMTEAGFMDTGKQQPGAGGEGGPSFEAKNIPGGCKTKVELMEYIRKTLMPGKSQKEHIDEFDKWAHLLPNAHQGQTTVTS